MLKPDQDIEPPPPLRVGVIGVGGVARYAHLPAYRQQGITVSAVCDMDAAVAADVAREFHISGVESSAQALAARSDVDIVDIATPPATHADLIEIVAAHGKPMLVQKPLCTTPAELERITRVRDRLNPWIRLNLTGRYVSAWQKVAQLLAAGQIGEPFLCTIRNRDWWDRDEGRWDHDIDNYIVFEMMIHHLDLCRYWFGSPSQVAARTGTHPAQHMQKANWAAAIVEYSAPKVVQILEDWTMGEFSFADGHPFEEVLISGERGVIRATSECVQLSDPTGNALRAWHLPRPGQTLPGEQLSVAWFPNSFGVAMAAFIRSVHATTGKEDDWASLVSVTQDTFAVSAAAATDAWAPMDQRSDSSAPSAQPEAVLTAGGLS